MMGEINPGIVAIELENPRTILLNCGAISNVLAKKPDIEKAPSPIKMLNNFISLAMLVSLCAYQ